MTAFWVATVLMFCGALMFLLPPILRRRDVRSPPSASALNLGVLRDQLVELDAERSSGAISADQHADAVREIQHRALWDGVAEVAHTSEEKPAARHWVAAIVAVLVAVPAYGVYLLMGAPEALGPIRQSSSTGEANHGLNSERIIALVEGLSARLKSNPTDGEGWAMLARSYGVLGRHQDALIAYQRAVERIDNNAQLLADYADTLALLRGRKLAGEPYDLVKRALAIDPRNVKALALAGTAEMDAGNPTGAIAQWEAVLRIVPADAPFARSIAGSIAQARQKSGAVNASGAGTVVAGTVSVASALVTRVTPSDTVFVFARSHEGSRMPLAIMKRSAADLPFQFKLDDSMGMGGGTRLSEVSNVVVGARISRSGSATPRSGDLETVLDPRRPDGAPIELIIDRVVP